MRSANIVEQTWARNVTDFYTIGQPDRAVKQQRRAWGIFLVLFAPPHVRHGRAPHGEVHTCGEENEENDLESTATHASIERLWLDDAGGGAGGGGRGKQRTGVVVCFFNRGEQTRTMTASWAELGLQASTCSTRTQYTHTAHMLPPSCLALHTLLSSGGQFVGGKTAQKRQDG